MPETEGRALEIASEVKGLMAGVKEDIARQGRERAAQRRYFDEHLFDEETGKLPDHQRRIAALEREFKGLKESRDITTVYRVLVVVGLFNVINVIGWENFMKAAKVAGELAAALKHLI